MACYSRADAAPCACLHGFLVSRYRSNWLNWQRGSDAISKGRLERGSHARVLGPASVGAAPKPPNEKGRLIAKQVSGEILDASANGIITCASCPLKDGTKLMTTWRKGGRTGRVSVYLDGVSRAQQSAYTEEPLDATCSHSPLLGALGASHLFAAGLALARRVG